MVAGEEAAPFAGKPDCRKMPTTPVADPVCPLGSAPSVNGSASFPSVSVQLSNHAVPFAWKTPHRNEMIRASGCASNVNVCRVQSWPVRV